MTRRIMQMLRACTTTPAWAVHFHNEGPQGQSTACFDARCELAPLAVSDRPRFTPTPSPPAARRVPRRQPSRRTPALAAR